jgi:hypothetical protein
MRGSYRLEQPFRAGDSEKAAADGGIYYLTDTRGALLPEL